MAKTACWSEQPRILQLLGFAAADHSQEDG
jgi:hypothetical protein